MKKITIIFAVLILALLMVGCKKTAQEESKPPKEYKPPTITGENWDPYSYSAQELCGFQKEFDDMIIKDEINEVNGVRVRELDIKSSNYCLVNLNNAFKTVEIEGYDSTFASSVPLMPVSDAPDLDFPPDSEIIKVEIVPQNEVALGKMNIPCTSAYTGRPGDKSKMTDCSDEFNVFPPKQSNYSIFDNDNEKSIVLYFFPIKHDLISKETTLFKNFNIKIHYKSKQKIIISDYSYIETSKKQPDKQYVNFYIANMHPNTLNLKIKAFITDSCYDPSLVKSEKIIFEKEIKKTVEPNKAKDITINLDTLAKKGALRCIYLDIFDQDDNQLYYDGNFLEY